MTARQVLDHGYDHAHHGHGDRDDDDLTFSFDTEDDAHAAKKMYKVDERELASDLDSSPPVNDLMSKALDRDCSDVRNIRPKNRIY